MDPWYQKKRKQSVEDVVGRKVVEQPWGLHDHAVDDPRRKDAEPIHDMMFYKLIMMCY
jgi:hypothetical protein